MVSGENAKGFCFKGIITSTYISILSLHQNEIVYPVWVELQDSVQVKREESNDLYANVYGYEETDLLMHSFIYSHSFIQQI